MKTHVVRPVALSGNISDQKPATHIKVNEPSHRPAAPARRVSPPTVPADYDQAERDMTGESDLDRQDSALGSPPPADPGLGSTRRQVPDETTDEEDREGRSLAERAVGAGARKAEQDKVNEAAHAAAESDRMAR